MDLLSHPVSTSAKSTSGRESESEKKSLNYFSLNLRFFFYWNPFVPNVKEEWDSQTGDEQAVIMRNLHRIKGKKTFVLYAITFSLKRQCRETILASGKL